MAQTYRLVLTSLCLVAGCHHRNPDRMSLPTASPLMFEASPGTSLFYEISGNPNSKRDILFLHGFGASTENWADVRGAFEDEYRIVLLDLKGHGRSSRPRDGHYSLDLQADLLRMFISKFCQPKPVIVGHSYGGAVALLAMVKEQQEGRQIPASELILVDVPAYPQPVPFFLSALYRPVTRSIVPVLPAQLTVTYTLRKAFYDHRKLTPTIVDRYVEVMKAPNSYYALGLAAKQMLPKDLDGYLGGIRLLDVPLLLIWGSNDTIVPVSVGGRLHCEVPRSVFRRIDRCGHVPQEECPETFVQILHEYLQHTNVASGQNERIQRPIE